ncbi:MAG: ABC transporter permease [Clostridiaceae bacterium]|nr:ABC transporter permease [Clostridiaceae bacterium]
MAINENKIYSPREKIVKNVGKGLAYNIMYKLITILLAGTVWYIASWRLNSDLLLPSPFTTARAFLNAITDEVVLKNISITMVRVFKGFGLSMAIGVPLGFLMGFSKIANNILGTLIDSIRQVPIMAWVPLTIIWLGLGDGPTIFLITMSGIFPVILNTITGVQNISKDYYNAAKTMGASRWSILKDIVVPATLPDIMVGARLAMSLGWMSVI